MEATLEDNKKTMEELTVHLKKLEEEGIEVMKACQEAEVSMARLQHVGHAEEGQLGYYSSCVFQAALPEVQQQYQGVVKEINALQQQEHALQEESLNIRLRIEQIEATITEHCSTIKHWQKEVPRACFSS